MKKAYSFRLSDEAILAIRVAAKERGVSEAAVVEGWATGGASYNGITAGFEPAKVGSIPTAPAIPPTDDKREIFEALKNSQIAQGKPIQNFTEHTEEKQPTPYDGFRAPMGDDMVVIGYRNKRWNYQIEGAESSGLLPEKKVMELWEKRIT